MQRSFDDLGNWTDVKLWAPRWRKDVVQGSAYWILSGAPFCVLETDILKEEW